MNDPLLPFSERELPSELRAPTLVVVAVCLGIVGGAALGLTTTGTPPYRFLRAIFFSSAFAYLVVSLFDFWEHFRLEKLATGRWWSMTVVPLGETLNHTATGAVIVAMFALARPLPPVPSIAPRDWFVIATPALFWILGWRDELVYHQRRSVHREDLMHTVAHLAAGVMMCTFLSSILFNFN